MRSPLREFNSPSQMGISLHIREDIELARRFVPVHSSTEISAVKGKLPVPSAQLHQALLNGHSIFLTTILEHQL
jgi:hypothetical protein